MNQETYVLRISRLTVEKLGVKLYDKVSAVVAELIANAYDADAEKVTVHLPLSTHLTSRNAEGDHVDLGYVIEVEDDGHGMTPSEAQEFYLQVGRNRRNHVEQGAKSREKKRSVMGRKGIGKLAPFGVCKQIEVISAGGQKTSNGYQVAHFLLNYEEILQDVDDPIELPRGNLDGSYRPIRGTTIRLSKFLPKRVPSEETLHRQIAARFAFLSGIDFEIFVHDTRKPQAKPTKVQPISIPIQDGTRIDLSTRPLVVTTDDGESRELPVDGWLAMAREPYKHEELAGIRIYVRNKLAAMTRDFERPAGFTGEFTVRSYLVGQISAEWLDLDEGEDLIRSDRQGIIWDSEYGQAFQKWGKELVTEIGSLSQAPRRKRSRSRFLKISNFTERARNRYSHEAIVEAAIQLAERIGSIAAEDELADESYVMDLVEFILSIAPHQALIQAFKAFSEAIETGSIRVEDLVDLFSQASVAEVASYAQIAAERVKAINELESIISSQAVELEFQRLIASAPWLIEPTWSVVSRNQALKTFVIMFKGYWMEQHQEEVEFAIGPDFSNKRPDFVAANVGKRLHIIEIKRPGHRFDDGDFDRFISYIIGFRDFFSRHLSLRSEFPQGWCIDLVADEIALKHHPNVESFKGFCEKGEVKTATWVDFLTRAKNAHEAFLEAWDTWH